MESFPSFCIYWKWSGLFSKIQPYVVVASCFLINISIGSLYALGNMIPYVVSYIRIHSVPHDLRLNTVTYIYAAQAVGIGLAMLLGGILDKHIGPRLVVLFGGLWMVFGAMISYITIQHSFWLFILTYGLITGIGLGIIYVSPIACSMRWLPKWKGFVSGIVLAGIALGTFVYSIAQTGYINPHNVRPSLAPYKESPNEKYFVDPGVLERVPFFFVILGISYALIVLVGCVFLVNPAPKIPVEEDDVTVKSTENERLVMDNSVSPPKSPPSLPESISLTPLQALKTRNFYMLLIMLTIGQTISSFVNPLYKSFGLQEIVRNDHFLTLVGSVGAIVNLIGRIVWALLADLTNYKLTLVIHGAFQSFFLLTFYATTSGGKFMYFFWVCCIFFGIGGYVSLFPGATVKSFGPKDISLNYGIMASCALTIGSLLAGCMSQAMVNIIEWYGTFFALGGISCVYFIFTLLYQHKNYGSAD